MSKEVRLPQEVFFPSAGNRLLAAVLIIDGVWVGRETCVSRGSRKVILGWKEWKLFAWSWAGTCFWKWKDERWWILIFADLEMCFWKWNGGMWKGSSKSCELRNFFLDDKRDADNWKVCEVIRIFRMDWYVFSWKLEKKKKINKRIGKMKDSNFVFFVRSRFKDGIDL